MLDRLSSDKLCTRQQRDHAPALLTVHDACQRLFETIGAFERPVELRETNAGPLPRLVFDLNEPGIPAELEFAFHKQSHTPSGAPEVLGPSGCRPELLGDEPAIEPFGKLQVNPKSLTYDAFTVVSRMRPRDRNSNNAVICDGRSSAVAA